MRSLASLALPLLAALALAGCSGSSGDGSDDGKTASPPTASSYTITIEGFPLTPIPANSTFTFTDRITGDETRVSDHIGAHFGSNSTQQPSTTAYPVACQHTSGNLPGTHQVTCTAPSTPGSYFLRGHARIIQDDVTTNWWSTEQPFVVTA